MNFSKALEAIKDGKKLARASWNGKDMFVFLVDGSTFEVNRAPLNKIYPEGTIIKYQSHIDMRTANGSIVPWAPVQSDLLDIDWIVVE